MMPVDIGLPREDGYALCSELRAREEARGMPRVALTGCGQLDYVQRGRDAGFDLHVTKPATPQQLASALDLAAPARRAAAS